SHRALSEHKTLSISWSHYQDGEPVCVKEDGYFVNVRIINDSQISSLFDEYVVAVEHQLRSWM
ncbi:hypothetical protein, partial [Escherichia coli]|uniref:hypothetical protein n=1 Tax=Escherichia coli TaxID=562 RepID=UPI0011E6C50A